MQIWATTDTTAMAQRLDAITKSYPDATARALNRSIASARTAMVRAVAQDMGLKVAGVRERSFLYEAAPGHLEASLRFSLKRMPLIEFGAKGPVPSRGRGRGVTYRLGGATKRASNAFIATMASGHRGVFQRVG